MAPISFQAIHEAALIRHGSGAVEGRLTRPLDDAALIAKGDDRYLSAMAQRIFRAGLRHDMVDAKWPAFEEVFMGFDPARVAAIGDERLEEMLEDRRLIRHLAKLRAARDNAIALRALSEVQGGFGRYLAGWPGREVVGLWADLGRRFKQLGGNSAANFLRMVGKDTFILTDAVGRGLVHWQTAERPPKTKAELAATQATFNYWAEETGRPLCQLSQILAMSVDS